MNQLVSDVKNCILKYKVKDIAPCVNAALDAGVEPGLILDEGMIAAMNEIGDGFKNNTIYMPQMLMAAKTMQTGLAVLKPRLKGESSSVSAGRAIVGSVLGDVHDIGKNLVSVMLEGSGMEVEDLGSDVSADKFLDALAKYGDVKLVACSSSMTPTRPALQETVEAIKKGYGNIPVFVGGATMDQQFCDEIEADVYTGDAASAAERAKQYLSGTPIGQVGSEARNVAYAAAREIEEKGTVDSEDRIVHRHTLPPKIRELKASGKYDGKPLTIMENVLELLKHDEGCPDAFLNQYWFDVVFDPVIVGSRNVTDEMFEPKEQYVDGWGVTHSIPKGSAGSHPEEGDDVLVIHDITKWKEQVKGQAPTCGFPEEAWNLAYQQAEAARKAGRAVGIFMAPGLFERTHFLLGMKAALEAFYEHPDEMHELIDWIVEWEIKSIDEVQSRIHADVLFHHDDWGTAINSFLDPATHREFFCEPYKKIYNHFKEIGGKVVVHHSDSYAANLVPIWIDAGVDIWQGPVSANDIPALIDEYGDKFVFMGGIDNAIIDRPDVTDEEVEKFVRERIEANGCRSYIPCLTRGLGISICPGVYEKVSKAIDKISKEKF